MGPDYTLDDGSVSPLLNTHTSHPVCRVSFRQPEEKHLCFSGLLPGIQKTCFTGNTMMSVEINDPVMGRCVISTQECTEHTWKNY